MKGTFNQKLTVMAKNTNETLFDLFSGEIYIFWNFLQKKFHNIYHWSHVLKIKVAL